MKRSIEEFRQRALFNPKEVKGGGGEGPIDRDKVKKTPPGIKG